jgi:hypothetical protein
MRTIPAARLVAPALLVALTGLATCTSANVIGPENQLQVTNAQNDFQFQVSNLDNVTQTLTYSWSNTGDSANVNQASSLSGGSATLTIRGPTGTVLYQSSLQNNGTFHTLKDAPGAWQLRVAVSRADGTLNFRVQRAP